MYNFRPLTVCCMLIFHCSLLECCVKISPRCKLFDKERTIINSTPYIQLYRLFKKSVLLNFEINVVNFSTSNSIGLEKARKQERGLIGTKSENPHLLALMFLVGFHQPRERLFGYRTQFFLFVMFVFGREVKFQG